MLAVGAATGWTLAHGLTGTHPAAGAHARTTGAPSRGLLRDMGRTVTISTVRLLLGSPPGADFQVRVGAMASSLTDLSPVAQASDAGGQVSLHLTRPARGRYVLIWFTQLPPATSGTFQASVYNVSLEGYP